MHYTELKEISAGEYSPKDLNLSKGAFLFEGTLVVHSSGEEGEPATTYSGVAYIPPQENLVGTSVSEAATLLIFPENLENLEAHHAGIKSFNKPSDENLEEKIAKIIAKTEILSENANENNPSGKNNGGKKTGRMLDQYNKVSPRDEPSRVNGGDYKSTDQVFLQDLE